MPAAPQPSNGLMGTPATNRTENVIAASTIVVPRFGCSMISNARPPNATITGRSVTRVSSIHAARRARRSAPKIRIAELRELRRLDAERADADPARRAVDVRADAGQQDDDEQAAGDEHQRPRQQSQPVIVGPQGHDEGNAAERQPQQLSLEVVVGRALLVQRGHRRRGQHHDETDEVQHHDHREEQHEAGRDGTRAYASSAGCFARERVVVAVMRMLRSSCVPGH